MPAWSPHFDQPAYLSDSDIPIWKLYRDISARELHDIGIDHPYNALEQKRRAILFQKMSAILFENLS